MMPKEKLRKADMATSISFILLGVVIIGSALRMPIGETYGGVSNEWYVSPAAFPIVIGCLLILCSLIVLARAIKEDGHLNVVSYFMDRIKALPSNIEIQRIGLIVLLIGGYVFFLFGTLNFAVSGPLFLLAFFLIFYRPNQQFPNWIHLSMIIIISALVPLITGYVFQNYLQVMLP